MEADAISGWLRGRQSVILSLISRLVGVYSLGVRTRGVPKVSCERSRDSAGSAGAPAAAGAASAGEALPWTGTTGRKDPMSVLAVLAEVLAFGVVGFADAARNTIRGGERLRTNLFRSGAAAGAAASTL